MMTELLSTPDFLAWAAARGIDYDPRYPRSESLAFVTAPGHWRFWEPPPKLGELAWFVGLVLDTVAADGDLLVFPHHTGHWHSGGGGAPSVNDAQDVVVRGAGIPPGFVGAARFAPSERAAVVAVAVASLVFGWGASQDLYFVPAHGRALLLTEHDEVISGAFPTQVELQEFTARLVARGYADPDAAAGANTDEHAI